MQENGGSSRTEEGESPSVLAFFVSCPGTCNISAGMSAARRLRRVTDNGVSEGGHGERITCFSTLCQTLC